MHTLAQGRLWTLWQLDDGELRLSNHHQAFEGADLRALRAALTKHLPVKDGERTTDTPTPATG